MAVGSSVAQYLPSRYSSTYTGTLAPTLTLRTRSLRTTFPANTSLAFWSSSSIIVLPSDILWLDGDRHLDIVEASQFSPGHRIKQMNRNQFGWLAGLMGNHECHGIGNQITTRLASKRWLDIIGGLTKAIRCSDGRRKHIFPGLDFYTHSRQSTHSIEKPCTLSTDLYRTEAGTDLFRARDERPGDVSTRHSAGAGSWHDLYHRNDDFLRCQASVEVGKGASGGFEAPEAIGYGDLQRGVMAEPKSRQRHAQEGRAASRAAFPNPDAPMQIQCLSAWCIQLHILAQF